MMCIIIKASLASIMVSIDSCTNPMSTSIRRTGALICPISLRLGQICASEASFYLAMWHTASFKILPLPTACSTFNPVASFVSAVTLHWDCPPSLLKALAASHPDCEVWLQSYYKEKHDIESLDTYCKITLGKYCAHWEKGSPKAIPTMCVLTIKKNKNLLPLQAKSCIIVLENHEDRIWSKLDRFALVLRGDLSITLSVLWWKNGTRFVRAIARMPFVRASCLQTKLRLCVPQLGTRKLTPSNIGSYRRLSTAFFVAHVIGTTRLTGLSNLLALNPLSRTPASSSVFSKTLISYECAIICSTFSWAIRLQLRLLLGRSCSRGPLLPSPQCPLQSHFYGHS
jgi:hypothetical protein